MILKSTDLLQTQRFNQYGGESIFILFEHHRLPLLIKSSLIGTPYSVSMFVWFLYLLFSYYFHLFLYVSASQANHLFCWCTYLSKRSKVSMFVYFSTFDSFLCVSPANTFLVLTHCLHYCVASCNYGDSRTMNIGSTCWLFRATAWQHVHMYCKAEAIIFCCCFCLFSCCK